MRGGTDQLLRAAGSHPTVEVVGIWVREEIHPEHSSDNYLENVEDGDNRDRLVVMIDSGTSVLCWAFRPLSRANLRSHSRAADLNLLASTTPTVESPPKYEDA